MAPHTQSRWLIPTSEGGECEIKVGRSIATAENLVPAEHACVVFVAQPATTNLAESLAVETAKNGPTTHVLTLPDGERAKDLSVVGDLYEKLNTLGFTRRDLIVAVGGGALTDTAGFVAGTYLRGVAVTYLSTTLLGAVDAAIGGKTGVNVGGKNLVGLFRHPQRIVIDLEILAGLPAQLIREGAAEAVKAGFISDPAIVVAYEEHGLEAPLDLVVPAAVAVKVETVIADFTEAGQRAILNYGHTIGHAVEVAAGLSHGEAVAIGMVAAGQIASHLVGFAQADRQRRIIDAIGLPVAAPEVDGAEVLRLMQRDKKRDADGLRMVLLEDFGKPVVRHVGEADVRLGLEAVGISI